MNEERADRQLALRVAAMACMVSALFVGLDLWNNRDQFNGDGISYLDMADAYRRGDWPAALTGVWSPLYPWLLAAVKLLFNPSAKWEFTAVHILNFFIYLTAMAAFSILMIELLRAERDARGDQRLPAWSWIVFGYSLFTWSVVRLVPPYNPQPDLVVCAVVYLLFAMLFRFRSRIITWPQSILLGLLLAVGYLAKGIMFPMAFVFGAVVLVMAGRSSVKMFSRVFAALAVFLLLSTPYIVALSHANDRVMFNDAGRLNYAWEINRVKKWAHWQGEEGVHGTPVHPTRKIHEDPPMYEFGTPFEVTYPPWYNPTYWYDGVKLTVDLRTQASVIARNLRMLLSFLANATGPVTAISASGENLEGPSETTIGPLLTLLCFMTIVSWNGAVVRRIWAQWFLLVPVGAALAAYALLHYEGRYIAPYVVVLWIVLFRSVAVAGSAQTKKVFTAVLASAALLSIATLAGGAGRATLNAVRSLADPNASVSFFQSGYSDWKVVEYLHNAGVSKETRVGAIGWTYTAYWARMAQVHIVAEIPAEGAASFWSSDTATRDAVMDLFRKAGAKAVVARSGHLNSHHEHEWDLRGLPGTVAPLPISTNASISPGMLEKWHHIDGTDYYVFVFPISSE